MMYSAASPGGELSQSTVRGGCRTTSHSQLLNGFAAAAEHLDDAVLADQVPGTDHDECRSGACELLLDGGCHAAIAIDEQALVERRILLAQRGQHQLVDRVTVAALPGGERVAHDLLDVVELVE